MGISRTVAQGDTNISKRRHKGTNRACSIVSFRTSFNCHLHNEFFFFPGHPIYQDKPHPHLWDSLAHFAAHIISAALIPVLFIRQLTHLLPICYSHANLSTRAHPLASFIHCCILRAWHLGGAQQLLHERIASSLLIPDIQNPGHLSAYAVYLEMLLQNKNITHQRQFL